MEKGKQSWQEHRLRQYGETTKIVVAYVPPPQKKGMKKNTNK